MLWYFMNLLYLGKLHNPFFLLFMDTNMEIIGSLTILHIFKLLRSLGVPVDSRRYFCDLIRNCTMDIEMPLFLTIYPK